GAVLVVLGQHRMAARADLRRALGQVHDTRDLFHRRLARERLLEAVFADRAHAVLDRRLADRRVGRALGDELAHVLVESEDLEDARTPAEAGLITVLATAAAVQRDLAVGAGVRDGAEAAERRGV